MIYEYLKFNFRPTMKSDSFARRRVPVRNYLESISHSISSRLQFQFLSVSRNNKTLFILFAMSMSLSSAFSFVCLLLLTIFSLAKRSTIGECN